MDNGERIAKWILRNLRQAKNTHGYGLVLMNFTQQSIRNMENSPKRAAAATELPVGFGSAVRDLLWTSGAFYGRGVDGGAQRSSRHPRGL